MTASRQPDAEHAPLTSPAAGGPGSTGHDKAVERLADVRLCGQMDRNLSSASWGDGEKEAVREAIKASRGIWAHYLRDAEAMLNHLRAALAAGDADVAEALGIHPCGHIAIQRDCGGCDPGAVEFVRDDGGEWRREASGE